MEKQQDKADEATEGYERAQSKLSECAAAGDEKGVKAAAKELKKFMGMVAEVSRQSLHL